MPEAKITKSACYISMHLHHILLNPSGHLYKYACIHILHDAHGLIFRWLSQEEPAATSPMVETDPSHAAAVIRDPPTNELVETFQVGYGQKFRPGLGYILHRVCQR